MRTRIARPLCNVVRPSPIAALRLCSTLPVSARRPLTRPYTLQQRRPFATMAEERHGNFSLVKHVDLDYAKGMTVEKWQSKKTGLTVYWANFESPLLNCYCTIRSEIFNDSGVPHTLEHLIFLGSQQYPYKGMLDTLANRAFAQGTNAWTAQDHTAYTLTTAGSDGFLRMMSVYLDHIFHPTLTAEGFTTEVYHVNGKGEDAGVVFSEMQGCENTSSSLMQLSYQRKMYPSTSAYRSETGGLMSALRVLTIDEIRKYHHTYYQPYNTALVICGPLDRVKLFDSIMPVEDRLVQSGISATPEGWKRPFIQTPSATVPRLEQECTQIQVPFPEKDESLGEVMIVWNGPKTDEFLISEAIGVLGTYLTDSAVSPIHQAFIEREDPFCTDVYFGATDKAGVSTIEMYFSSVPTERVKELDGKLVSEVLSGVADKAIDMDRMKMLLERERIKLLLLLETKPADAFSDVIINDFLYGQEDGKDLKQAMDEMRRFDQLAEWTSDQWTQLLRKYLIDNPRIVTCGTPSATLAESLKNDAKALVEKRKKELGEEGLKRLDEALKDAQKANDTEIPNELLTKFQIPNVDSIEWIHVGIAEDGRQGPKYSDANDEEIRKHLDQQSPSQLPVPIHWADIKSNFVSISFIFSTKNLTQRQRVLLTVLLGSSWSLPVHRPDGQQLTYEEVVKGLDQDVMEYESTLGYGSGFAELAAYEVKVERKKYEKGFQWLQDILWHTKLDLDRIKVNVSKLAQSLPEQRRAGRTMSWALSRTLTHSEELSTNINNCVLNQSEVIPAVVEKLSTDAGAKEVLHELAELRENLFKPENMIVSVAGQVTAIENPYKAMEDVARTRGWTRDPSKEHVAIPLAKDVLTELGKKPSHQGLITPLATIESSFAVFSAKGIASWQEPDSAALAVTVSVLNALESYLWRYIRGAGLAYGSSIKNDTEAQLIHFTLYRSPNSAKAFAAAADVIGKLVSGEIEMDDTVLDSAKSSLCFGIADTEGTVSSAAGEAFTDNVLRGLPKGRGRRLLEDARTVTKADVLHCLKKYVAPIFDPQTSICAVACATGTVDEIQEALEKIGYKMTRKTLNYADDDAMTDSEVEEQDDDDDDDDDSDNANSFGSSHERSSMSVDVKGDGGENHRQKL